MGLVVQGVVGKTTGAVVAWGVIAKLGAVQLDAAPANRTCVFDAEPRYFKWPAESREAFFDCEGLREVRFPGESRVYVFDPDDREEKL